MIFPLRDDDADIDIRPLVTYLLIAANVVVFLFLQQLGANLRFTYAYVAVPAEILTGVDVSTPPLLPTPINVYLTLITSMFMHGGIGHIAGNMLYLWIFGDNLEHHLGTVGYLLFYLICGVGAALAFVFALQATGGNLNVALLGASGAISGVLGGYIVLFPRKRVLVLLLRFPVSMPAWGALGIWIGYQLVFGAATLGASTGVAYVAHIGGFAIGAATIRLFPRRADADPPSREPRRPPPRRPPQRRR